MNNSAAAVRWLGRVHWLLFAQTCAVMVGSVNRLSSLTLGYVAANEFLRWVDLINMLPVPIFSIVAFYLLKKHLEHGVGDRFPSIGRAHMALNVLFIVSVYVMGASYGDHEVTNYLHARFCSTDKISALCRIIIFNDDEFGHWLFFAAFIGLNVTILLLQPLFPYRGTMRGRDKALLIFNSLFIAAGIFANLGFEEIGLDLYVVLALAILSVYLLRRHGPQPLFVYYAAAYVIGLVATFGVKLTM
ncbi:MAG: hypothetical protein KIH69_004270 [Anaerolineae bacterium]|nr:hypothetical protein [Anaerolineae bacterium]